MKIKQAHYYLANRFKASKLKLGNDPGNLRHTLDFSLTNYLIELETSSDMQPVNEKKLICIISLRDCFLRIWLQMLKSYRFA